MVGWQNARSALTREVIGPGRKRMDREWNGTLGDTIAAMGQSMVVTVLI
jgi:hypothetical protein